MDITIKCQYCGNVFVAHSLKAKWCSKKCKDTAFRIEHGIKCNASVEPFHKQCVICGKSFDTFRDVVKVCSHECAVKNEKNRKSHNVIQKHCAICETNFETYWQAQATCGNKECQVTYRKKRHAERSAKAIRMKPKRTIVYESRVCVQCGKLFSIDSAFNTKTCSDECRRKWKNKSRDNRIPKEQIVDTDITLDRLFKRDNGICWICGKQSTLDDWQYSKNGKRYPGDNRAEIDHVIPVSRGGLHSWDNVRIAHHKCNHNKGDSIYPYVPLEAEFAYSQKKDGTQSKKTAQYTLDGNLVRIWDSTMQIKRELGLNEKRIQNVCRKERSKTGNAFGFHWEYIS